MIKIGIIGSGNVATHLANGLSKTANVIGIYSKTKANATTLAKKVKSKFVSLSELEANAELIIIAVNDDQIEKVAKQLKSSKKLIVHTSGSVSSEVLKKARISNYGVFYPLQTFSKSKKVDFSNIPICVYSPNKKSLSILKKLASALSGNVTVIDDEQRKIIHLAAVFACNFSNHMYAIADDILKENNLSLDLLKPLIAETANKIQRITPKEAQTGPAKRKDNNTIKKQLKMLEDNADWQKIYKLVTQNIQKQ